jgi:hypothetical protein
LPFILLKTINLLLAPASGLFDDNLLFIPSPSRPWRWQDFEELHLHFQAVRINSLLDSQKARLAALRAISESGARDYERSSSLTSTEQERVSLLRKKKAAEACVEAELKEQRHGVPLSDIIPGGHGVSSLLRQRVQLSRKQAYREARKLLTQTTDQVQVPAAVTCEAKEAVPVLEGVFLCAKATALFDGWLVCSAADDGKPFLILWQDKHSELDCANDAVSVGFVKNWHAEATASLVDTTDYRIVLLFFTNRRLSARGNLDNKVKELLGACDSLVIVARDYGLTQYLTPAFAYRGILASTKSNGDGSNGGGGDQ